MRDSIANAYRVSDSNGHSDGRSIGNALGDADVRAGSRTDNNALCLE
jgi:hypothetical protein